MGRIRNGMTVEQALTAPLGRGPEQPCKDHLGNEFPSLSAMLRHYGLNYTVFQYRRDVKKWTLEKTLTAPVIDTDIAGAHQCVDHEGNVFPSKKAMCEHWHIPRNVYFMRKKAGKSIAECLAPVKANTYQTPVYDHTGRKFTNLDAMCAHWNILKSDYIQNIRNGLPLSRALTERTQRPKHPKDHTGREHESINAMCRAWGITKTTLRARLELGWTLEQILTHPENNSHKIQCQDHLGNQFPSQKAMLDHYHISHTTFKHRLKNGCGLEQALTTNSLHTQSWADHLGNPYPSLQAMLEYWFCNSATWHYRYEALGWDIKTTLTTIHNGFVLPCGPDIEKRLDENWFLIRDAGGQYIAGPDGLFRQARENALIAAIQSKSLPRTMRIKFIRNNWFQIWNTDHTGAAPGMILNANQAWMEYVLVKYTPVPSHSKNTRRSL